VRNVADPFAVQVTSLPAAAKPPAASAGPAIGTTGNGFARQRGRRYPRIRVIAVEELAASAQRRVTAKGVANND